MAATFFKKTLVNPAPGSYMSISLSVTAVLTTIGWLAPLGSLAIGTAAYPIINDNVTKSNIKDKFKDIINTYEILRWNYIKMNLQTIKKMKIELKK